MIAVEDLALSGVKLIKIEQHKDKRGWFEESFHKDQYKELGIPYKFVQDNISYSVENVIRGMHIQRRHPQGKLVRCLGGLIYDVILDLRPDSITYGKLTMIKLEGGDGQALYIPAGFAHGFITASPLATVHYKCTTPYDKESDGGVNPMDPELDIKWDRILTGPAIMSDKDKALPTVADWLRHGG